MACQGRGPDVKRHVGLLLASQATRACPAQPGSLLFS
jgi:hypothetical protein